MTGYGEPRERIKITTDKIKAEVNSLNHDLRAPLRDAVAERFGVTANQLSDWLRKNTDSSTGGDLGIIPQGKVTEVLCLSLGEHFKKHELKFTFSDLAGILHTNANSLYGTLIRKPEVIEALKDLGLVISKYNRKS